MKTLICPTCGCSLVRLGISKDKATVYRHNKEDYYFCCQGCVEVFTIDPQKYIKETDDMIVCPTCLAEKPVQSAVKLEIDGNEVSFAVAHIVWIYLKRILIFTLNVYQKTFLLRVCWIMRGAVLDQFKGG